MLLFASIMCDVDTKRGFMEKYGEIEKKSYCSIWFFELIMVFDFKYITKRVLKLFIRFEFVFVKLLKILI